MTNEFTLTAYENRIEDLFRRFRSVQTAGFTGDAYKPGLAGMQRLCARLGDPWKQYPCIHVAGTNGKGSVCSLIASALATGRRIGLYTSPHLLDFRERMKVVSDTGFEMISREEVWEFLESYEPDFEGLSFFEITTGMAFWWFARQGVDAAVIETGLGGRLDSTNVITPVISIVTSIGLDHCALLGSTREQIAFEKAGIFKPGVPAVVGLRDPETAPVFEQVAAGVGAPLVFASDVPAFTVSGPEGAAISETELLAGMDLTGPCQDQNLHTSLTALSIVADLDHARSLQEAAKRTGLWGRWQRVNADPEVICDIGHNPPALKENFARLRALQEVGHSIVMVYGIMADKDLAGIAPLFPQGIRLLACAPKGERSLPAEELSRRLSQLRPDISPIHTIPDVASAVRRALDLARDLPKPLVYVGGSTFTVAEALPLFNEKTAI